ncbi:ribonucleases P/MRP protein subunit POP1 isoform X2 [Zophobas morio]|uniref:ribonucleases P/MRP protein subunit POP1 isoform X2 n=1 Tax=Zophobas morio TaxID=2755281 RepID=UPI003082D4F4
MANEEAQLDTLPGGEELPPAVTIARFVACRSQEIQVMKNSLGTQFGTKLAFQTLPKHMRRRAMSHNVKRLPRRLRQIHLNQMKKSGMPTKQKRPSRKYRRRPRNLTEEYTRRSNKRYKWLYTHIWHAKRFHMTEKWGYKLPHRPCDKAFRACYRAMSQHCLLQDISYFNGIEISGDRNVIIHNLKYLSKPDGGLSISAKAFINGNREGELTLYEMGDLHKTIGNVKFQWFPSSENTATKLWLWIHPAFYENVKRALTLCFKDCPNILFEELRMDLSRFRLTGPLSNSVLHDALQTINIDQTALSESYLRDYIKLFKNKDVVKEQSEYWNQIKNVTSTADLSPHSVCSVVVNDPRFYLPKKRVKSVPDIHNYGTIALPDTAAHSPLWYKDFRKQANNIGMRDSEIAELRSKLLVPGSNLTENTVLVPVILIQQPGNKRENIGLGGGWDIILPNAWAKPFWIAFVMRGARAGEPDTDAGINEELLSSKENVDIFFRKPPNKRINYNKFKIASPFTCNWNLLLKEWGHFASSGEITILRNKKILNSIEVFLNSGIQELPDYPKNCLIPVKLICEARGCPQKFAIICLPQNEKDLKKVVTEPNSEDKFQAERKELRRAHQSLLKKFRKQRKAKSSNFDLQAYKEMLINYSKKIRALWLPEPRTIRYSCSREVVGFVHKGGFSFSLGKSSATGYIVSDALLAVRQFKNRILLRNTNSRQYKVANLTVILE